MSSFEYEKQALDFLQKANATMSINFVGLAVNREWKEDNRRNLYNVTITSPRGSMTFDFWDSIHNTEVSRMSLDDYAIKKFRRRSEWLHPSELAKVRNELNEMRRMAKPTEYDVLACMTKYDPGTFEDFCSDFGYDEDSRAAERIYFAVQKEYAQLSRLFAYEQMDELREIN